MPSSPKPQRDEDWRKIFSDLAKRCAENEKKHGGPDVDWGKFTIEALNKAATEDDPEDFRGTEFIGE